VPFAATAKNPDHTSVFCDLHTEALRSDPAFNGGFYADSNDVTSACAATPRPSP
jgi:homoserine O-acetyltransferase